MDKKQKLQVELQNVQTVRNKYSTFALDQKIKLVGKKGHIKVLEVNLMN
jgi:hypothetical protein